MIAFGTFLGTFPGLPHFRRLADGIGSWIGRRNVAVGVVIVVV